jgi:capsular exopolysaccharide synthesis family protein
VDTFVSPWSFAEPAAAATLEPAPAPEAPASRGTAEFADEPEAEIGVLRHSVATHQGPSNLLTEITSVWRPRLAIGDNADFLLVEQFRQLAATLHQCQTTHGTKVVMVTSADPGEGKSLTTVNLALTLSESYKRTVMLVDGDLRRPSLHEITNVPNPSGLAETLKSPHEQKLPLFRMSERLTLIPAGQPDPNPMAALTSPRMRRILDEAVELFDWVLIDAPPLGPVADANLLAPMTDGALLVVRAGRTQCDAVQKAVEALGKDRILGVVLNGVDRKSALYRRYHAGYRAYSHATGTGV